MYPFLTFPICLLSYLCGFVSPEDSQEPQQHLDASRGLERKGAELYPQPERGSVARGSSSSSSVFLLDAVIQSVLRLTASRWRTTV
ncbi:hypothetical protein CgunFtcFv8_012642 [Champsocephalus gunnari]|uniref:Secreted protein n=1 Tax=Champsocephalus gunnari TaxID=52237 RepID=A0AAN8DQP0_CHAGU|nr:hypothetical protein CgunFtcFv8_012642 [Champsocephalus gunnari]